MKRACRFLVFLCCATGLYGGIELPDPPALKVRPQVIDDQIQIGYGLAIADVDGDGRDDILLVDKNEVVWYKNPTWKKYRMAGQLTPDDNVCIAARDIDNDGRAEVAVGAGWKPAETRRSGAVFYLVPPTDRTREWEPVRLQNEPTVHRMAWVRDHDDNFYLAVLPLYGRGNSNGEGDGARIMGYRRPPDPHGAWETFLLNDELHLTHDFEPVRWAGPGKSEDLLVASKEGLMVITWEKTHWFTQQLTTNVASEASSGKLPSGRRLLASIEPFQGNEVVVNTPAVTVFGSISWTRNRVELDDSLNTGQALATGDLLGDGWDQVVAGWRGPTPSADGSTGGIKVYAPLDKRGYRWKLNAVVDKNIACEDLKLADLNGDGKLDIIACGGATHNVVIYWNETVGAKR